ncbi:DNA cytosine methyltransferase [Pseudomonas sp. ML96]|uniref:DNA cytosine methyltransferase n=1 Tax=Pseudomonas sp. ML96 TaxID=1523503 RepID=UPI0005BCA86B|nr:DNA cytosine methyltransferase [Pseudomonas sp. ML96]
MAAYYNEIDPYAAQWLRNLIKGGHIAPGDVDERSIEDVHPDDLRPYTQCHFFAGIGIWSLALRRAGWPDSRPVWTGSCPCQPFSTAGAGAGFDDKRHLWPDFHWLIRERRPVLVFGEQVASKAGLAWLDLVQADLGREGYAFGCADICSAGAGSENGRQRLYFVADTNSQRQPRRAQQNSSALESCESAPRWNHAGGCSQNALFAAELVVGASGESRLLEPGTVPLVAGYPTLLERLRAYGNGLNVEAATQFIGAYLDATT